MIGQLKSNNIYNNTFPQKTKQTHPSNSFDYSKSMTHNIPQHFDNILDPTSQQEMIQEILNISKIKDGFYISDKISAISLDVINDFKITHIINTTGNQIMNQWESIGVNYLTINWSENPSQILFDLKDEIAEKIVEFIDKALTIGEGVLAHSFNGKNRVCLVALIYLMKKYKWSLYKSMQYLKSKKTDVEIPNYFYNQLDNFQKRLIQKGELTRDIPWEFENLINEEEKLMRNTYMNGLPCKNNLNLNERNNNIIIDLLVGNNDNKNKNKENVFSRHIFWADNNPYLYPQSKLEIINSNNDLCIKKDIKPINCHIKCKPIKSCIKTNDIKFSDIEFNISVKKNNINVIKQKINFDCSERNVYRNEYLNKLEYNNQLNNDIKKKMININDIDKNISNNNTNSNTPALKEQNENKSSSDIDNNNLKNKFTFNIGSVNSLNPKNINDFGIFEDTPKISKDINKQNRVNIINYTPINMNINNNNNKKITVITKGNKFNNSNNIKGVYNKKNINNKSNGNNISNKPLNNFNPNLIKRKGQVSDRSNYPSSHPLFNKNKNKDNVPIKIKNFNNSFSNIKKPTTSVLNHNNNNPPNIYKDNFNSSQTSSMRYNSTKKLSSSTNNFNSTSSGISFNNNNINTKNSGYDQYSKSYNKSVSDRPSTAPHKELANPKINNGNNNNTGINFNSNINSKIKKNKSVKNSKSNQRPLSAENKNKYKNNFGKNYNNNINTMKANNYYNGIYGNGTRSNTNNSNSNSIRKEGTKGMNQNNMKTNNNSQKFNLAKQRRPSPVIKSENIFSKKTSKSNF